MVKFQAISGSVPGQVGEESTRFRFDLPARPKDGAGLLFYTVDTREGSRSYRVEVNGASVSDIALPSGNHFATFHTLVSNLKGEQNRLSFASVGTSSPPVNILNVVLFYEDEA